MKLQGKIHQIHQESERGEMHRLWQYGPVEQLVEGPLSLELLGHSSSCWSPILNPLLCVCVCELEEKEEAVEAAAASTPLKTQTLFLFYYGVLPINFFLVIFNQSNSEILQQNLGPAC